MEITFLLAIRLHWCTLGSRKLCSLLVFPVELTADCHKKEVHVRQLGCNPCKVGNRLLARGDTATATESVTLCVLADKYEHYFKFKTRQSCNISSGNETTPKRKAGHDGSGEKVKRRRVDDVNKKEDNDGSNDGSDSEHMEAVKKQLKLLKENMKKAPVGGDMKSAPGTRREHVDKTGEAVDDDDTQGAARKGVVEGRPTKEATWKQHDSLMLYTSSGVVGRSKVSALYVSNRFV